MNEQHEAIGARVRRSGQVYIPRTLGGFEDLWFYHTAQKHTQHVILAGPPGSGKSAGAEAAFDSVPEGEEFPADRPMGMYTLLGTESTTVDDFVGSYTQDPDTGLFKWVHGPLVRSILEDVPFFIDEVAQIDPRVLTIMYPLMDGRGVLEVVQNPSLDPFRIGPNWFVLGAYNPDVPGAVISEALSDRFDHAIEIETDWNLARSLGVDSRIVGVAENLNIQRQKGNISWSPQFRSLMSFRKNHQIYGFNYAVQNLIGKTPKDDRGILIEALASDKIGAVNARVPLRLGAQYTQDKDDFGD